MRKLSGKVCLVTGASRGAGLGIAAQLGEAGATVYVTGRSRRGKTTEGLPGSVDETAEEVSRRGGTGIPVICDHTSESDVDSAVTRILKERSRLDLLVNNAWGGYEHYDGRRFSKPFWEQDFEERWRGMFIAGLRPHLLTSHRVIPAMIESGGGLIISTIAWDRDRFLGGVFYDVAKHAIARMCFGLAKEVEGLGICAVALAPGFMRTERVMAADPADWPDGKFDLSITESPQYIGCAVVALASDPEVCSLSGQSLRVGDLAEQYGFTDVDGRRVRAFELP